MPPFRQIRALYDEDTITVYQAFSAPIADAAVKTQCLSASPEYNLHRGFTWIKPSWCWMMYRSGYSFKDDRQARILALRIKHTNFQKLLSLAAVTHDKLTPKENAKPVRVQWDPERSPKIGMLPYRSIQIGISGSGKGVKLNWPEGWIESIEDVTETARALKRAIDEGENTGIDDLTAKGLLPVEKEYELPEELKLILKMGEVDEKM